MTTILTGIAEATVSSRTLPRACDVDSMGTASLRESFLVSDLFQPGALRLVCTDLDRMAVGGVVPLQPILLPPCAEFGTTYFTERRELGVINLGCPGHVRVGSELFTLETMDCLYIGMGEEDIVFAPSGSGPPVFYLLSCGAHHKYPTVKIARADAQLDPAGDERHASMRTIRKCIHPDGAASCQLVMGYTELAPNSVWNTMPPHTHLRRSEIYLYTNLGAEIAVHLMGSPDRTRSLIVRDREAVLSPPWSIHTAAGTGNYSFVWGMAGENQTFADMDPVKLNDLF
jgi:4-deoxy-L-threo-5-hexosulose-uronate ketol-isomerase